MSPLKVRKVARAIQGRNAGEALEMLSLIPRKSARLIGKTLKSAIANAENNNNLSSDALTIKSTIIEEGPAFKRFRPAGKRFCSPLQEKNSHIRIVLTDEN